MIINQNGEVYRRFGSVDEALDSSINGEDADVLEVITGALDEVEALLLLAQRAEDYERTDSACRAISEHLSRTLGYDKDFVYDIVRELSGLSARYRYAQHQKRLEASRRQVSLWRKSTQAWIDAANLHAEEVLGKALEEVGFLQ